MTNKKTCVHLFDGAKANGKPFSGWAGKVTEWLVDSAPTVDFGKWIQDKSSRRGGGQVSFICEPFDLVMFGANSKIMRSYDKSTQFGFAGLSANNTIKIALLPAGIDARKIFTEGGWKTPDPQAVAENMYEILNSKDLTLTILNEHVASVRLQVINGFGVRGSELDNVLACWEILYPIQAALATAAELIAKLKSERADIKMHHAKKMVIGAVSALREIGVEPTYLSVIEFWMEGQESNHQGKEKVRNLKKILGDKLTDLSWALEEKL